MENIIIAQENIKTKILLEGKYDFITNITIGLTPDSDFYLLINFLDISKDNLRTLAMLSKLPGELSIQSEFFEREQYKISHIVVTKFITNTNSSMKWECLSDNISFSSEQPRVIPELYKGIFNL